VTSWFNAEIGTR